MKIRKIFGKRLKMLRLNKNEHQSVTSAVIGVGISQMSELESGKKSTNYEKIALLALHFGVTTDYLLGLSDDPKKSKAHKPGTDIETVLGEKQNETVD